MLNRLLFIITLVFNTVISQPLSTEKLSMAEGLSDSRAHYILQDRYGLLWITTSAGGLNMFDGYTFKIFKNVPGNPNSILSNELHGLSEDADGNIWVATSIGVSKYNRANNSFVNYDFEELFPEKIDVFQNTLLFAMDNEQNLWVTGSGLGMVKYDGKADTWNLAKYQNVEGETDMNNPSTIDAEFDQKGRLWVGNFENGLMWFDETDSLFKPTLFKESKNIPDFTKPENSITCIYKDPTNILWITSRIGVYKFNPETRQIKTIQEYSAQGLNFWTYYNTISQDNEGNIWISNNLRGILKFDGISDEFEKITLEGQFFSNEGISNIVFTSLHFDNSGIMWVGTVASGLLKHDPHRAAFKHFKQQLDTPNSLSNSQIFGLYESKKYDKQIYVGLRGGGLNIFDPIKEHFRNIPLSFTNDMFGGSVRTIQEEIDGTLWVGTWGDGLIKLNSDRKVINHFKYDSSKTNSLPDNAVRILERDAKGNYWIGTTFGGVAYLDTKSNSIKRFADSVNREYSQELLDLVKLKQDTDKSLLRINDAGNNANLSFDFKITKPRKYLLISTGEGSVSRGELVDWGWISDAQGQIVWNNKQMDENFYLGGAIKNRIKIDIQELKPGNYTMHYKSDESHSFGKWNQDAPTYLSMWGIQIIELEDPGVINRIQRLLDEANNQILIEGRNIRSIHVNKNGIVWIGSDIKGLTRFDPLKKTIKNYKAESGFKNRISDNSIQFIHEDKNGILWLATNGGLNRFDPITEKIIVYTEEDGLPTNYIASILPGENENLWLASRNGLSKMITSPSTKKVTFVNYNAEDGLGGTDFIAQVALKSSAGDYYFGGEHGLNVFKKTEESEAPPSLYLADLSVGNVSLLSQKSEIKLDTTLTDISKLELVHDKNDLSFTFSALHFSNPQKNQYAHFLKGYDDEWIYDNKRIATYTNLDPGNYKFSFKGSNRDGVWNDLGKSISITILPPCWQTIWAYILYGIIFIVLIWGIDRIQRRRLLRKANEQLRIREIEMRAETAELQAKATEAERRALQAENERKSQELEEARELQLSMLPKELPQLPNLDIAVYMKTATEVGGDYYDFNIGLDGTLTVVLGDATGHGMKAGTMVTTTKSLFNVLAPNPNIIETFHEMTRCLKLMQMEKLSMCLTMLKIMGNKIKMSSAGMPPVFIHKRESQTIEEHVIKGMPLGTFNDFPYSIVDCSLSAGDTILLMSDGFPELLNENNEMYGYKRARNFFEEIAGESPEDIISKLKNAGSDWVNDKDPDDDVTFVVIKVK